MPANAMSDDDQSEGEIAPRITSANKRKNTTECKFLLRHLGLDQAWITAIL